MILERAKSLDLRNHDSYKELICTYLILKYLLIERSERKNGYMILATCFKIVILLN